MEFSVIFARSRMGHCGRAGTSHFVIAACGPRNGGAASSPTRRGEASPHALSPSSRRLFEYSGIDRDGS